MKFTRRFTIITFGFTAFAVGIITGSAWLSAAQDDGEARTQYDSFELDTPTHAVQTFVDTFQRSDYAGLFLIFAPETQRHWYADVQQTFDYGRWVKPGMWDEVSADVPYFSDSHGEPEQNVVVLPYVFDAVMYAAEQHDALAIDLRGDVEVAQVKIDENATQVDVPAMVEGINGQTIFRMVKSPAGRWRVQQVIVPGGDEEAAPWSVPAQEASD